MAKKVNKKSTAKKAPVCKKKTNRTKKSNTWKWALFKWIIYCGFALFVLVAGYVGYCYLTLPDMQKAISRTREPSTIIMAENGSDIAKFGNVYAQVIAADNLPKNLTDAIISTEDRRFYKHNGFDAWGFSRAIVMNVFKKRYAQGASTITQQVA